MHGTEIERRLNEYEELKMDQEQLKRLKQTLSAEDAEQAAWHIDGTYGPLIK